MRWCESVHSPSQGLEAGPPVISPVNLSPQPLPQIHFSHGNLATQMDVLSIDKHRGP